MKRIGFVGYDCAETTVVAAAVTIAAIRRFPIESATCDLVTIAFLPEILVG
jgi:hypothetical protein